jgi:hypothetical protein
MIHVITKTAAVPGIPVVIDCPVCSAQGILAGTADVTAREYLYGVVPVSTTHWTTITCSACGKSFRSSKSCADLALMTPQEVSDLVATFGMSYVADVYKIFIVASILMPCIGVIFALIGILGTRGTRSRWRTAAYVGLVTSLAGVAVLIWAIATGR